MPRLTCAAYGRPLIRCFASTCLLVLSTLAGAAPTDVSDYVREATARNKGYADYQVQVEMTLRQAEGATSVRELRVSGAAMVGDGDRTLIVFDAPQDQRGTALLSYAHRTGDDEQWLFLPAIKRVKRIIASNRSGPFVGSEFAFEDLLGEEVERYNYRWPDVPRGKGLTVVERTPNYANSGYTRQLVSYDAEYRIAKIEYFDRRGELLKSLEAFEWKLWQNRFWRPERMVMTNHQTHKVTQLVWRNYRFNAGLKGDTDFSVAALERIR